MCESNVYLTKGGKEELIMEDVSVIKPESDGMIYLEGLMGNSRKVNGRIKELRLLDHKIILEEV